MCENGNGLLQDDLFVLPFLRSHLDTPVSMICVLGCVLSAYVLLKEKRLTATFIFGPKYGMQSETVKFV